MTIRAEPWTPPSGRTALLPAGKWWDAVRVPATIGKHALALLGAASGAVIEDPIDARLYWLIKPGAADQWDMTWLPGIELRGQTAYIDVPPQERTTGPRVHWRAPLRCDRYLTDPAALLAVLKTAANAALGPREEVRW